MYCTGGIRCERASALLDNMKVKSGLIDTALLLRGVGG